jgi:hypothetical protein
VSALAIGGIGTTELLIILVMLLVPLLVIAGLVLLVVRLTRRP